MGLFSKRQPEPPVRRDQVMKLLKLGMKETDAADRDIDSAAFDQAKAAYDRESGKSTQAELKAARDTLNRHGY